MSKKNQNIASTDSTQENTFYFGKKNFKFMLIGLACIIVGFFLMMGPDANTTPDGKYDPNYWNDGINSIRRIRIAPFLVIAGFVIEIYAILIRKKTNEYYSGDYFSHCRRTYRIFTYFIYCTHGFCSKSYGNGGNRVP